MNNTTTLSACHAGWPDCAKTPPKPRLMINVLQRHNRSGSHSESLHASKLFIPASKYLNRLTKEIVQPILSEYLIPFALLPDSSS